MSDFKQIKRSIESADETLQKTMQIKNEFKNIYWAMHSQLNESMDNGTQSEIMDKQADVLAVMNAVAELDKTLLKITRG